MKQVRLISLIVAMILLFTACAPAATPAAVPIPDTASTSTMQPADTLAPTTTAQPTNTTAPTAAPTATETMAPSATATQVPNTLVDVAVANGNFKTLVAAVQAADLVDALKMMAHSPSSRRRMMPSPSAEGHAGDAAQA